MRGTPFVRWSASPPPCSCALPPAPARRSRGPNDPGSYRCGRRDRAGLRGGRRAAPAHPTRRRLGHQRIQEGTVTALGWWRVRRARLLRLWAVGLVSSVLVTLLSALG